MSIHKFRKDKHGFTIIELMVSASIIAIISVMVIANFRGSSEKFALDNEAERLASVIRQAHINSLIGSTVNGVRPSGGFGIYLSECGEQYDCTHWTTPCNEYYCNQYSLVCSSGNMHPLADCYKPHMMGGCSGDPNVDEGCCCDGTWENDVCTDYDYDNCIDPGTPYCDTWGMTDLGECRYTLFADQDADGEYDTDAGDTLVQSIGMLDENIYIDELEPADLLDITFLPPRGDIYIDGSQTEDQITITLGFGTTGYSKVITIDRRTGKIDIN